jgi:hypothetical protein
MAVRNSVYAIPALSVDSSTFAGAYIPLTAVTGLPNACFLLRIINTSTVVVGVSYDGVVNHDYIPIGGTIEVNAQSNGQPNSVTSQFAAGFTVYVLAAAGAGFIYLAGYFNPKSTV